MDRLGLLMAVLVASLVMPFLAFAADDPSDLYLKAYQTFQNGEELERDAKPQAALDNYRAAEKILTGIAKDSPDWRPLVVSYRLKKTQENIFRLQGDAASNPPAPSDGIEGPMPTDDKAASAGPEVSQERAVGTNVRPSSPRTTYSNAPTSGGGSNRERELLRQIASLKAENDRLNDQLARRAAELTSTMKEIDMRKVAVVELKSQVAQLSAALEDAQRDAKKDGSAIPALREQYDKKVADLTKQLSDAQNDLLVLQDENNRIHNKLDQAATYITSSDNINKGLLKDRSTLEDERDKALARTKRIKDNAAEIEKVTEENKTLKGKLADVADTTVTKAEYAKVVADNKTLKSKLDDLMDNVVKKADYEKLVADNKALTEKLAKAEKRSASKDDLDKLAAEKKAVETKLAAAEKALKDAAAASPDKDKQIAALQSELNSVNDKLLEAQAQTAKSDESLKSLQAQLDESTGQLAQLRLNPNPTKEEKTLTSENELLRGIILRQLKDQAQRDEAKKQVDQEVGKLQIKSDVLNRQLAVLSAPVVQLTAEEKALFKEPVALLNEPGSNVLAVSMAVSKTDDRPKDQSAETVPDDVRDMMQKAKKLFDDQNYLEAENLYQQIVDKVPDSYVALSNLGAVQIQANKLSAAEVALRKAIKINDKDAFAQTNLGILLSRQAKFDEAITSLRSAIALNEGDAIAHNYLGVCLANKEQRPEAEKEFKRSIEIKPDYAPAHFNLAVLYATTQPPSIDLAKLHYNKATSLGAPPDASLERLIQ